MQYNQKSLTLVREVLLALLQSDNLTAYRKDFLDFDRKVHACLHDFDFLLQTDSIHFENVPLLKSHHLPDKSPKLEE